MSECLLSNFEINDDYVGYGGDNDDKEKGGICTDWNKRNWKPLNCSWTEEWIRVMQQQDEWAMTTGINLNEVHKKIEWKKSTYKKIQAYYHV